MALACYEQYHCRVGLKCQDGIYLHLDPYRAVDFYVGSIGAIADSRVVGRSLSLPKHCHGYQNDDPRQNNGQHFPLKIT